MGVGTRRSRCDGGSSGGSGVDRVEEVELGVGIPPSLASGEVVVRWGRWSSEAVTWLSKESFVSQTSVLHIISITIYAAFPSLFATELRKSSENS